MKELVLMPKQVHYCWFGGKPLPDSAIRCINSWNRYLPGYIIKEWNESNFDVNMIPYIKEAYEAGKYAFVSDYARFWIIYHYGGLYFDTDVELIKSIDDIIERGAFMGCERRANVVYANGLYLGVNPGLGIGACPGLEIYKELLSIYSELHFIEKDGRQNTTTIVDRTTELLINKGLQNTNLVQQVAGIWVYPQEFFCPKDYFTGKTVYTDNTRSIHHYSATWLPKYVTCEQNFWSRFGLRNFGILSRLVKIFKTLMARNTK